MSINSIFFYIQFHAQTPHCSSPKKKKLLFYFGVSSRLYLKEKKSVNDWCFEFTVYLGPWLESMLFLRAGFVEWRQQYSGFFFGLSWG